MKTPITYYGGKQSMLKYILPLIPKHKIYVEPFIGGGAVFWVKEPTEVEVINDTNREVINFYAVTQRHFKALKREIKSTLHSREQFRQAQVIYKNPELFTPLKRAWAFWVLACQSYSACIATGWRHAKSAKITTVTDNRRRTFQKELAIRLEKAQIECADALRVIKTWDDVDAFFYVDPPYFNAHMGHYKGYTLQDFTDLLKTLSQIKGKFLLSSYPSDVLSEYTKKQGWKTFELHRKLGMRQEGRRDKTEVLTMNYEVEHDKQVMDFSLN